MNELNLHNAEEKLKKGKKSENNSDFFSLVQEDIIKALLEFCRQSPKLCEAVIRSDKTIYDCCRECFKDTKGKTHISDLIPYKRAVQFYYPEADIEFCMKIKIENGLEDISLMDLLGV